MSYDIHYEKSYSQAPHSVYEAALKSAEKLSGKILSSSTEDLRLEAKFDKTILGSVLGDRTQLTCRVRPEADQSTIIIDAYPLDAVGRKLMFGARQGVTQKVIDLFITHLESNLK